MMMRRKRVEPKMGLGTDMIMGLLMAVLLSVMITEEVYAQQQQQEVVNGTYLHQYVLDDLENAELISVQVFQDGRMILVFKLSDESEKRMVIRTQSPLTPEAGYQWGNSTIYNKEGSKLVFELEGRGRNR
jgi:phage gp45-like